MAGNNRARWDRSGAKKFKVGGGGGGARVDSFIRLKNYYLKTL